jgi:hypothetical protein
MGPKSGPKVGSQMGPKWSKRGVPPSADWVFVWVGEKGTPKGPPRVLPGGVIPKPSLLKIWGRPNGSKWSPKVVQKWLHGFQNGPNRVSWIPKWSKSGFTDPKMAKMDSNGVQNGCVSGSHYGDVPNGVQMDVTNGSNGCEWVQWIHGSEWKLHRVRMEVTQGPIDGSAQG